MVDQSPPHFSGEGFLLYHFLFEELRALANEKLDSALEAWRLPVIWNQLRAMLAAS
jgi:hypothetical protein